MYSELELLVDPVLDPARRCRQQTSPRAHPTEAGGHLGTSRPGKTRRPAVIPSRTIQRRQKTQHNKNKEIEQGSAGASLRPQAILKPHQCTRGTKPFARVRPLDLRPAAAEGDRGRHSDHRFPVRRPAQRATPRGQIDRGGPRPKRPTQPTIGAVTGEKAEAGSKSQSSRC